MKQEKDPAALPAKIKEKFGSAIPDDQLKPLSSPWYRYFLAYDPAPALAKVKCPVLALNGEKDTQVSGESQPAGDPQDPGSLRQQGFRSRGNARAESPLPDRQTGSVGEYEQIEETMSPAVLEKVAAWILKHCISGVSVGQTFGLSIRVEARTAFGMSARATRLPPGRWQAGNLVRRAAESSLSMDAGSGTESEPTRAPRSSTTATRTATAAGSR